MTPHVTRLAPSPTGALHIGNARTFVINYLLARRNGWRVLMRVEDLDGPRVKRGATEEMLNTLSWLGLTWDGPVVVQSERAEAYRRAFQRLVDAGAAYPCTCSRKDIALAASAPHAEEGGEAYPGTCRDRFDSAEHAAGQTDRPVAWRLRVDDEPIIVSDRFCGDRTFNLARDGGDFVIVKNSRQTAYQLAVVVDDAVGGVDTIVRGDDLLESAARQIVLRRMLGLAPEPTYWHLPLVVGPDGKRLAKRHGDTRLSHYRNRGTPPQRVLGLIGAISGMWGGKLRPADMDELSAAFDPANIPRDPIVFTDAHDAFLLGR